MGVSDAVPMPPLAVRHLLFAAPFQRRAGFSLSRQTTQSTCQRIRPRSPQTGAALSRTVPYNATPYDGMQSAADHAPMSNEPSDEGSYFQDVLRGVLGTEHPPPYGLRYPALPTRCAQPTSRLR